MKKIHVILNSHLDPVWAWKRSQGIDEVIATARTACTLIERFPEIIITRGEAWFYETLEKCAPDIFRKVAKNIECGRWHVTGGFYIQPDCNIPMYENLLRQGEYSQNYFESRFGLRVKTGFNVDSFGHAATIPDIWNACGIENYVMSRPENAILNLPGNLFEWHGVKGGILNTYRLSGAYCTVGPDLGQGIKFNFESSLAETAPGVEHFMGFVGVGNHGGGPVASEIAFLLDNPDIIPGWEIEFSTPDRYFEAVKNVAKPVWKNELQHHAVGCYSAVRSMKSQMLTAEKAMLAAENCLKDIPENALEYEEKVMFDAAWKKVWFATFHDVLPGTSVKSAYEDIYDDLGFARSTANNIIEKAVKLKNNQVPASPYQQLIFDNFTEYDRSGIVECEPWLGYDWCAPHNRNYAFYDENGNLLASQEIRCECAMGLRRFAVFLDIPAHGRRIITIREDSGKSSGEPVGKADSFFGVHHSYVVYPDKTDTWSHSVDRYPASDGSEMEKKKSFSFNRGVLFSDTLTTFCCGANLLNEVRRDLAEPEELSLALKMNWQSEQQILKMEFRLPFEISHRYDAVPGAFIPRSCNGKEYPVAGAIVLSAANGRSLVIAGEFTACDVQSDGRVRLTLLRTPIYSHHDPRVIPEEHAFEVSGCGESTAKILLAMLDKFDAEKAFALREKVLSKPFFSEVTLGCASKYE
ncbi:MAG: hypothetical protein IJW08_08210 [Lentisphaeria bacterium]|nr:hypothetical protein [Lentisphaeria bacterium]